MFEGASYPPNTERDIEKDGETDRQGSRERICVRERDKKKDIRHG